MPKQNHSSELQPSNSKNVPDAQRTRNDPPRQPTIVTGEASSGVVPTSPSERPPTTSPSACQSDGDEQRDQGPKGSVSQPTAPPRPDYLGESRKPDERKAEILRRARELDPPLTLKELEHMSAFKAALQIHQPMDDHAWEILRPRLISQLPAALSIIQQNEQLIQSIMEEQDEQARPRSSSLTATGARDAATAAWNETQKPIRESLEQIARGFIDNSWSGGDDVTHQNVTNFAARLLIHTRREFLNPMPHEDRPRLSLDAMKWVYETVVKPITEKYGKNIFACNLCDAPLKSFEGCIQHYAAKHTSILSRGSAIVAWREADWPEVSPFNPVPASRRQSVHTPQPYSHISTSPFPVPPNSATPHSSSASWRTPVHPSPAQSPYYSSLGTPVQEYPSYLTSAAVSPVASHFWGAPPTNQATGYSPRSYGYIYPPPISQPARPPMVHSPITTNPMSAPPPPPPPPPLPLPLTRSPIVVNPMSAPHYPPPLPPPSQSPARLTNVTTLQGPERLGQMMNETWILLSALQNIDTSVLVYASVHNSILEFHARNSATPTLEMVASTVDNDPQLANLRDADKIDCKACTNRMLSHSRASAGESNTISVKLYKFNALLKHFRKVHEGKRSPNSNDTTSGYSSAFDWKRDMISLPDGPRIARLAYDPSINPQRLAVLRRIFPDLFGSSSPQPSRSEQISDEYDPRNPEMAWPTGPRTRQSNSSSIPAHSSQFTGMRQPFKESEQFDGREIGRYSSHGPYHTEQQSIPVSHLQTANSTTSSPEFMDYKNEDTLSTSDQTLYEPETEYLLWKARMEADEQFKSWPSFRSVDATKTKAEIHNGSSRDSLGHSRYYEHSFAEDAPYFGVHHHVGQGSTPFPLNQPQQPRSEQVDDSYPRSWSDRDYIPLSGDYKGSHKRKRPAENTEYEPSETRHSNSRDTREFRNQPPYSH